MTLTVYENEGMKRELTPEGIYLGVCCEIIDLGMQTSNFEGKETINREVMLRWELPELTYTTKDGDELPRMINKRMRMVYNEKSNLGKLLKSWTPMLLPKDMKQGFDLTQLLGMGAQVTVTHQKKKTGDGLREEYAFAGLMKGYAVPAPTHTLVYDLDAPDALAALATLPEWLQEIIREGETYRQRAAAAERPFGADEGDLPF